MKAPSKETSAREKLLEAGAQVIAEKSFNGCGLAEILERAGVPKGSFYHYFESKEDFGVALIEQACADYTELLQPIVGDRRRPPLERLRAVFQFSREECLANGAACECVITKLAMESSRLSDSVQAALKYAYQQWSALLARVIREAQSAGEIGREHDPDRLADVLVTLWEGATIRMQVERSVKPIDDFLTFVFDSLFRVPERR
jgi:TetR/AcrR family transcriptional repressor of nem operon